ncbi:MAG TPA: hypothetical protein VM901_08245 [Bdellovibrionota bacterium]|jgi:hypothetical protein|nr:hypothetical protein [Bdellovibrionota bacterium]
MDEKLPENDWIWDSVLEAMSAAGVLEEFHKMNPADMQNLMKQEGSQVANDMALIFRLTREREFKRRQEFIRVSRRSRLICVMFLLSRSIRWWFESGHGEFKSFAPRFPVAHA